MTNPLKSKLTRMIEQWREAGLPGHRTLMDTAKALIQWKREKNISGLWEPSPVFLTATLDDAWGHGLEVIEAYAQVMGLTVVSLGLIKPAQEIIQACNEKRPDYLGMTVLQFDSEDDLCTIRQNIPDKTQIIVGGPPFKADPDMVNRTGIHFMAKDVTVFIGFFLSNA